MSLTSQQKATLKAFIDADPVMSALPQNSDGAFAIAASLNVVADPAYFAWRPVTPASEIMDAITWANLTPNDTADGTATFTNRALVCQAKQLNLQILLQGRESVATGKSNVRSGLTDALTNVPSGANGAPVDAGWLGAGKVKTAITRTVTVFEQVFASGSGTTGTPSTLALEGPISYQDVQEARES